MGGFERKYRIFKGKNSPKWHYKYLFRLELVYSHYHSDNGTNSFFIKQIFKKKVGIMLFLKAKIHFGEGLYSTIETKYYINKQESFFVFVIF